MERLKGYSEGITKNYEGSSFIEKAIDSKISHSSVNKWPEEPKEALRTGTMHVIQQLKEFCKGNWNDLHLQYALDEIEYTREVNLLSELRKKVRMTGHISPAASSTLCSRVLYDVIGMLQFHTNDFETYQKLQNPKIGLLKLNPGRGIHRRSGPSSRRNG